MSDDHIEISFDGEQPETRAAAEERIVITSDDLQDEPRPTAFVPLGHHDSPPPGMSNQQDYVRVPPPATFAAPALPTPYVAGELDAAPVRYAGFWLRLVALLLDAIILDVVFGSIYLLCWHLKGVPHHQLLRLVSGSGLLSMLICWWYSALCESSAWQATPGKLALRLKVTDLSGRRVSFARATGRFFGQYLSALLLCVGFLMAGFTEKKQALHDLMAGCLVVKA